MKQAFLILLPIQNMTVGIIFLMDFNTFIIATKLNMNNTTLWETRMNDSLPFDSSCFKYNIFFHKW